MSDLHEKTKNKNKSNEIKKVIINRLKCGNVRIHVLLINKKIIIIIMKIKSPEYKNNEKLEVIELQNLRNAFLGERTNLNYWQNLLRNRKLNTSI